MFPFADLSYTFGDFLAANGGYLAGVKSLELRHHCVPLRGNQPLLAAQRARIIIVRRRRPDCRDVFHEPVDGLEPIPGRRRALTAGAQLMGDRYSRRKFGDELFRILPAPTPSLHLAGAVVGDLRLDVGATDDPASLFAMQPGADRPRNPAAP